LILYFDVVVGVDIVSASAADSCRWLMLLLLLVLMPMLLLLLQLLLARFVLQWLLYSSNMPLLLATRRC